MFSVEGIIKGVKQKIIYENIGGKGKLSGDELICFVIEDEMNSSDTVGPVAQYMDRDINNPLATLCVIELCFDEILVYEGDLPEADPIPYGAIS